MSIERQAEHDSNPRGQRLATVAAVVVLCAAVSGYFTGLSSPMPGEQERPTFHPPAAAEPRATGDRVAVSMPVIPATAYADIPRTAMSANANWSSRSQSLKQEPFDPFQEIAISEEEKTAALAARSELRAYNGAPPVIPHPIAQLSAESCATCHAEGLRSESLRAARSPHPYYANCTQCHVEQRASFVQATFQPENVFVGLPAPEGGPRAYPDAPPVIPHSTWMRQECLSCHGHTGQTGLKTTHPWRQNCLQCHATSSNLEQVHIESQPTFISPLPIEENANGN